MRIIAAAAIALSSFSVFAGSSAYQKALEQIQKDTGLAPVQIPDTQGDYLGKMHRGYQVIYTAKAGLATLTEFTGGRSVGCKQNKSFVPINPTSSSLSKGIGGG